MNAALVGTLQRNRKFFPLTSTIGLFLVVYAFGLLAYPAMRDGQAFFNLFDAAPFLIVVVVGEAFVIMSGGIDLSVSGVLALTTVVAASLLYMGWNAWAVFPVVLLMGMLFGLIQGLLITYLKVQPFIATLAGMWLARGLSYVISDAEVKIHDATYRTLGETKILIPGLSDPASFRGDHPTNNGDYITYLVVVAIAILAFGLFVAHFTRFGRTVYAMGGGNGMNEESARLMGLPVNRTKVLVYVFSGFCAALGGILYSIYVSSGRGNAGTGLELTAIAAVVIGGIALTGGQGYLIGALFGVLITQLIQSILLASGEFSSYLAPIMIGALMLLFIGVQGLVEAWNAKAVGKARAGGHAAGRPQVVFYRRRAFRNAGIGFAAVVVLAVSFFVVLPAVFPKPVTVVCTLQEMRTEQGRTLSQGGAVVVYERNGGTSCVDEVYAIYPDGKIVTDLGGGNVKETKTTPDELNTLLKKIDELGFFKSNFTSTYHTPCGACYRYSTTVTYGGQTKTVEAVDGGADAPANYWQMTAPLTALLKGGDR
jgi:ribose/xylose/arabinose/galactoside ABC-type transport system permease subunit